jgi:YopX protein
MNREIKFRAWDKREKKMCEADFFDNFYVINQGKVGIIKGEVFDDGSSFYVDYSDKNNWEVMQYTGLKDKNGKEIYEGDLIKIKHGSIWQVAWNEEKLKWHMWDIDPANTISLTKKGSYYDKYEVIGNIYENPELLSRRK